MSDSIDFDNSRGTEPQSILPPEQPLWAKVMAWATIAAGSVYMINPTLGVFELLGDEDPLTGAYRREMASVLF